MKIKLRKKPRTYKVGKERKTQIHDCGDLTLKYNEQISFVTNNRARHDVIRKNWGFYATQSINNRLKKNFKTGLVINSDKKIYLMLVEKKKLKVFKKYLKLENQKVIIWLDQI